MVGIPLSCWLSCGLLSVILETGLFALLVIGSPKSIPKLTTLPLLFCVTNSHFQTGILPLIGGRGHLPLKGS